MRRELTSDLAIVVRDWIELVECQRSFLDAAQVDVHETKIVDRLKTVGSHTDRLKVDLLPTNYIY